MRPIRLIVTDLDNTLYDWMSFFVPALYAMVDEASAILDVPVEVILEQLKIVHQDRGNSEEPFALLKTEIVKLRFPNTSITERARIFDRAFHKFNSVRKEKLQLYEGVWKTLSKLREANIPVVAYTDAYIANALFRIIKLNLTHLLVKLYAPEGLDPIHAPPYEYPVSPSYVHLLPNEDRKPNPKVLSDVCADNEVSPSETLYLGDSLSRDVYMAKQAGVIAGWASYGTVYDATLWPALVKVSHWRPKDYEREKILRNETKDVRPDFEFKRFSDVIDIVLG